MTLIQPDKKSSVAGDLRRLLGPDKVRDDFATRTAYAVDASIYRIAPHVVVLPETEADIQVVVRFAQRTGLPITPRAAGTNLTGSAIGEGIVLDVSRLSRILEINPEERWARVQPGVVFAELNRRLARHDLHFGPDPSSGDMCKLGGMLANNSSGPHTLRYGSVKDNVHALRACVASGDWLDLRAYRLDDGRTTHLLDQVPPLRSVLDLVRTHADLIQAKRPLVTKNSSGYNLFGLVDGLDAGIFDLPKLFIGSEGTLGIFSEATLRLEPKPKAVTTALIHFRHLEGVGDAVPALLALTPSALEVMDTHTLDLIGRESHGIPTGAAATLLAEFDDPEGGAAGRETVARLSALCRHFSLAADPLFASDPEQRERLWRARKALYPTLYRYSARKKPINFVDDVVVRADLIADLMRYLEGFFDDQRVAVAIFGHIGNGNAHIVPLLDVNDPDDFRRMTDAYREIHRTVLTRFGGSICGEHGDGRVRAEVVREMFGEDLYRLFVQVKETLDPAGLFNPGVKISRASFTEHIDYTRLAKPCATCAKCNSVCPVYDVFESEDMSARGWFEIVTSQDYSYLNSKRVVEACLNCKSCRTVCPAGVDVSDLILQRRAEHPNRLAGWIFAAHARPWLFERLITLAARTQGLWDRPRVRAWLETLTRPILRRLAETARLPHDLVLPTLARRLLRRRYPALVRKQGGGVAYFHGCAANYFEDGVGDAVITVLTRLGLEPALPPQRCSGTPIQTYGHQNLVRDAARFNLASLASYETVVTGCASCTLMLKDYPSLFEDGPERRAAAELAGRVKHISEILADSPALAQAQAARPAATPRRVTYHSSCHLRAAGVSRAPRDVLGRLPDFTYVEMQDADRCAGGAGTYVIKDYDTAQKIFRRKRRAIEESGADVVATSCPACLIQLKNGVGKGVEVRHVAELAAAALAEQGTRQSG